MHDCAGGVFVRPIPDGKDKPKLREWWHEVIRVRGRLYPCYAMFLIVPSDREAIRYLVDFSNDAEVVSGKNSLVITLSESGFRCWGPYGWVEKPIAPPDPNVFGQFRSTAIRASASRGYSVQVAQYFGIDLTEFPCLLIFRDIRSPEFVLITLKDMTAEEIATRVRVTFDVIHEAVARGEDVLRALERHKNSEMFRKASKSILSRIESLPGKTLEAAMEAWISTIAKGQMP